jgi:hypothetical protein
VGIARLIPSRAVRAKSFVLGSGGLVSAGVWQEIGHGWGLVVGGVLGIGYGLVLMDADGEV